MSALHRDLNDYLAIRRALGYKLQRTALLLADFVAHMEANGADAITTDAALAWASLPPNGASDWWAQRLSVVRGFARHLHAIDPTHEVPPVGLLPGRSHRATPYLYSDVDIVALMAAARSVRSPLRAATFETLVGLLAVTGLRIGEALRLDRDDVDLVEGVLTIRFTKFGKSREVPLHPSTVAALRAYSEHRCRMGRRLRTTTFFVSIFGDRLNYDSVHRTFHRLVRRLGPQPHSKHHSPRLHDLCHTFAVRTLLDWYRDGADVSRRLHRLSTYLGHIDPSATYWYLSAAPELLALAAERLESLDGELS